MRFCHECGGARQDEERCGAPRGIGGRPLSAVDLRAGTPVHPSSVYGPAVQGRTETERCARIENEATRTLLTTCDIPSLVEWCPEDAQRMDAKNVIVQCFHGVSMVNASVINVLARVET